MLGIHSGEDDGDNIVIFGAHTHGSHIWVISTYDEEMQ